MGIATEGLAHVAYLIGDSSSGTAALIDPAVDVDRYLVLAQSRRVSITHIFETHVPTCPSTTAIASLSATWSSPPATRPDPVPST